MVDLAIATFRSGLFDANLREPQLPADAIQLLTPLQRLATAGFTVV